MTKTARLALPAPVPLYRAAAVLCSWLSANARDSFAPAAHVSLVRIVAPERNGIGTKKLGAVSQ